MTFPLAGDDLTADVLADLLGQTYSATEATGGSTTSTSYTAVGATMGTAFVAPASGIVMIHFATAGFNSGANDNKTSVAVRTGSTVGSGTVILSAIDDNMILFSGALTYRKSTFMYVSGLTPGDTYNARMEHKTSAGTATFLFRLLSVVPQT